MLNSMTKIMHQLCNIGGHLSLGRVAMVDGIYLNKLFSEVHFNDTTGWHLPTKVATFGIIIILFLYFLRSNTFPCHFL